MILLRFLLLVPLVSFVSTAVNSNDDIYRLGNSWFHFKFMAMFFADSVLASMNIMGVRMEGGRRVDNSRTMSMMLEGTGQPQLMELGESISRGLEYLKPINYAIVMRQQNKLEACQEAIRDAHHNLPEQLQSGQLTWAVGMSLSILISQMLMESIRTCSSHG